MRNTLFSLEAVEKTFDYKKFEKEYFDLKSWGMQAWNECLSPLK